MYYKLQLFNNKKRKAFNLNNHKIKKDMIKNNKGENKNN
jgi:hypothetical protein